MNGLTDTHGRARRAGPGRARPGRRGWNGPPDQTETCSYLGVFIFLRAQKKPLDIHRDCAAFGLHVWPEGGVAVFFFFFSPRLRSTSPHLPGHECNYEMLTLFFFPKKATLNNSMTLCGLQAWTFRQLASIKLYLLKNNRRFHSGIVLVVITCFVS